VSLSLVRSHLSSPHILARLRPSVFRTKRVFLTLPRLRYKLGACCWEGRCRQRQFRRSPGSRRIARSCTSCALCISLRVSLVLFHLLKPVQRFRSFLAHV